MKRHYEYLQKRISFDRKAAYMFSIISILAVGILLIYNFMYVNDNSMYRWITILILMSVSFVSVRIYRISRDDEESIKDFYLYYGLSKLKNKKYKRKSWKI